MGQACCTDTADNLAYDDSKNKSALHRVSHSKNVPINLSSAKIP